MKEQIRQLEQKVKERKRKITQEHKQKHVKGSECDTQQTISMRLLNLMSSA